MPSYSLVITSATRDLSPSSLIPNAGPILEAFAEIARREVTAEIWAYKRFEYKRIKPRPSSSKSEQAWRGIGSAADLSITLANDVTNSYGTNYVPFVHLAGKPKSAKLVFDVRAHVRDNVGPRAARAIVHDMIKAAGKVSTREVKVS